MPKRWGQAVEWLFNTSGQADWLSPQSTGLDKYLTSQVFLVSALSAGFCRLISRFTQPFVASFSLLSAQLCSVCTGPIATTNLIKD